MATKKLTDISELGEFGLIKRLTEKTQLFQSSTLKGVGDDAAILGASNKQRVVTTDLLVEGVHFDLAYVPLKHLGYKCIIANLSDVCAMNAVPTQVTVSIAVSSRFSVEALEELYLGIHAACERYQVDLIGGDTSSSLSGMVISVTAIGEVDPDKAVLRSGASENDLVCVSGDLGAAYMGLQLLEREKAVFKSNPNIQPDLSGHDYILERQLHPEARLDMVRLFAEIGLKPTSMIDVSDGLSSEILHLCNESKLGAKLYADKIPILVETKEMAEEFGIEPIVAALSGGEDYELLFTVPLSEIEKIKDRKEFRIIGRMCARQEGMDLVLSDGSETPIIAHGWNAFSA